MSAQKYEVWFKENGKWENTGNGPLSKATAERIAKEVRQDCGNTTRVLPAGEEPV